MADRHCSNTFASLNNAVNGAGTGPYAGSKAPNETTIIIDAGAAANWSATEQLNIDNYVYIKGQGMGNTTINSPAPLGGNGAIKWQINAAQNPTSPTTFQWGLQGFTFNYTGGQTALSVQGNSWVLPSQPSGPPGYNGFHVLGTSCNFRCTDVKWYTTGGILLRWNDVIGLVDHCILDFLGQWGLVYDTKWGYANYGINPGNQEPYGHGSYELPVKWGTAENLYFEDCFMNYRSTNPAGGGCDSHESGRYVVRHCRFNQGSKPTNHGTESHTHGCRAQEVYQNWFTEVSGSVGEHRSGTMICHDNVVQGGGDLATYSLQNHRNFARKNQGSCRGENPGYMTDTREAVRYMLVSGSASSGAGSMNVTVPTSTVYPPNDPPAQQVRIPYAGALFQVKGESPGKTTHTIDTWTAASNIATSIQFHPPLLSNIADGAAISFMYPSCDQNTPLANDNVAADGGILGPTYTVAGSGNEPRNGNVSPDVYTGTAAAMGEKTTVFTAQTGYGAGWPDNLFKTENDNKALNKGFNWEVINTDEVEMGAGMVTTATGGANAGKANYNGNQIQISIAGVSGWPLGFTAGQNYAIRRVYAGADQPGMGVIDPILRPIAPLGTKEWPTSNTNAQTGTVAAPGNANTPPGTNRNIGWPNQKRDSNYNWNCWGNPDPNVALGAGNGVQMKFDCEQGIFILGRDFFETQKPAPGAPGVDPAISPGYPIDTTAPAGSVKRRIGAANISTISGNSTILWAKEVQSTQQITGLVYPHPMIQPPPVIPGPSIAVDPDSDAFTPVVVGTYADHQNLVITNNGDQPLIISSITSSSARFTIGTGTGDTYVTPITFPFTIAVGGNITKTVRFTPIAATSYATTISFDSNDTATHDTEQAYTINGSGQTAPLGPIMHLSTPSHGFGTVTVGQAASFTLTITNTGDEDLIISSVTFPSAPNNMFTFGVGQSTSFTLTPTTPNNTTTRDIIFTPAAAIFYSGTIAFVSNDPDTLLGRETFTVTGTGQGTQPPPTVHGKKKKKNVLIQRF